MASPNVLSLEELAQRLADCRRRGQRIVHCHGCFDLLHIGHIKHLQAAKRMGDVLVVTVTPDAYVGKGPGRPAFLDTLRAEALAALACVDYVAINRWPTAVETIALLKPDYYVKGQEFEDPARPALRLRAELAMLREVGGEVRFTHEATFSSTALLAQYFPAPREP